MKKFLFILITTATFLTACEPALYITFENHTSNYASLNVTVDQPNSYFRMKKAGVKKIEFTTTAINAIVEYSYGAGMWDDATLDDLVKGITKIEVVSGNSVRAISDPKEIRDLFAKNVHGKDRNGITLRVE